MFLRLYRFIDLQAEDYKLVFYPNECDSDELFFQADERVWEVRNRLLMHARRSYFSTTIHSLTLLRDILIDYDIGFLYINSFPPNLFCLNVVSNWMHR